MSLLQDDAESPFASPEEIAERSILFHPPLYKQRYLYVCDAVLSQNIRSVVDFGCAEAKLAVHLKQLACVSEITCVDIDDRVLLTACQQVKATTADIISPIRDVPLTIKVYKGSIDQFDSRLFNSDCITLIEVIEHLYEDTLNKLTENVFGRCLPRLVIVSTPNSEFNVCFGNLTSFRHDDHKFEWTRAQFSEWCTSVCDRYNYTVAITGVGTPPEEVSDVGFCSQIAVFSRSGHDDSTMVSSDATHPYELLHQEVYPHLTEKHHHARRLLRIQNVLSRVRSEAASALAAYDYSVQYNADIDTNSNYLTSGAIDSQYSLSPQSCDMVTLVELVGNNYVPVKSSSDNDNVSCTPIDPTVKISVEQFLSRLAETACEISSADLIAELSELGISCIDLEYLLLPIYQSRSDSSDYVDEGIFDGSNACKCLCHTMSVNYNGFLGNIADGREDGAKFGATIRFSDALDDRFPLLCTPFYHPLHYLQLFATDWDS